MSTGRVATQELIEHEFFKAALDRVERVVGRALSGESLILPLFGPTRVGKTQVVKMVMSANPPSTSNGVKQLPVVRVMTPVNPTRRSLPEALLHALGSKRYGHANSEELTGRASELLKIVGTRVIIFDEMQHFVERGSKTAAREAADWLKVLAEELGLTLVLVGLPVSAEVLMHNEQLRDRAEAIHEFRPYNWNNPHEQTRFRQTLMSLLETFAYEGWTVPDPQDFGFGRRVYGSTLGRIGMLFKLFNSAERLAKERTINLQCLFKAHAETVGTGFLQFNPFDERREVADSLVVEGYVRMLIEARMTVPKGEVAA